MTRDGTILTIDVFVLVPILAILAGLALILWQSRRQKPPKDSTDDTTGFSIRALLAPIPLPDGIKLAGFGLWATLFATLGFGVFFAVITALIALPSAGEDTGFNLLRGALITVAAITATLGAVVALPFTIRRSIQAERQTRTQEEGYVTDQINEAVKNLAAQKEVNRIGRVITLKPKQPEKAPPSPTRGLKEGLKLAGVNASQLQTDDEIAAQLAKTRKVVEWEDAPYQVGQDELIVEQDAWQNFTVTKPNIEVRIGAILALERLARQRAEAAVAEKDATIEANRTDDGILDHPAARDHVRIMEILCAYVRENAPGNSAEEHGFNKWEESTARANSNSSDSFFLPLEERGKQLYDWANCIGPPRLDIQSAIEVLGRRTQQQRDCEGFAKQEGNRQKSYGVWQGYRIDLNHVNLQAANLSHSLSRPMDFCFSNFEGARFEGAYMSEIRLDGARLHLAKLACADLNWAHLNGADLSFANLENVQLRVAELSGAHLFAVRLQDANLSGTKLVGAHLWSARLQSCTLSHTNLNAAQLDGANLDFAKLSEVRISESTNFKPSSLNGTILQRIVLPFSPSLPDLLTKSFGDASVRFDGNWPDSIATEIEAEGDGLRANTEELLRHWAPTTLDVGEYHKRSREFQHDLWMKSLKSE